MNRHEIEKVINEHGEDWMIAAMVEGSIGYHSITHAERIIERFKEGEDKDFCERCSACFNNDLLSMLTHDIMSFELLSPERHSKLINITNQVKKLSVQEQTSFGLMYLTARI